MGLRRDSSPSPAPLSRSASVMSRNRSSSCTPSLSRNPSDLRPVFSPVGSLSKLSSGSQSAPSMPAVSEAAGAGSTIIAFGRKTQLKLPPPVVTNSTRLRQNSAPGPAPSHLRSVSPSPMPRSRDTPTGGAGSSNTQSSSARLPVFSPPSARSRRSSVQNGPSNQVSDEQLLSCHRRPSLGTSKLASSTYDLDRLDSAYGSVPGSAIGNGNTVFDEPLSPSASSSSSVSSVGRMPYTQQSRQSSKTSLPGLMKEMSINKTPAPRMYAATRGDTLDDEFARILNASPIQMQVRRLAEGKYYFGGKVEELSTGGYSAVGGKMVLCRLMEHGRPTNANGTEEDSGVSSGGSHSGTEDAIQQQQLKRQPTLSRPAPAAAKNATLRRPEPAAQRGIRTRATSNISMTSTTAGKSRKVMVRVGGGWQDLDLFLLDHYSLTKESVSMRG